MKTLLRLTASTALSLSIGAVAFGQHYTQTNLVSNVSGVARFTDSKLVNPWGLSRGPKGDWWVNDNLTGFATLYNGSGTKNSLTVSIPPADPTNKKTPIGSPTGIVANNSTTDFILPVGGFTPEFIFSTIDGSIAIYNPHISAGGECAAIDPSCDCGDKYRWIKLYRPDQCFHRKQSLSLCSQLHQGPRGCL